jgi:hypothetical protein
MTARMSASRPVPYLASLIVMRRSLLADSASAELDIEN